MPHQVFSRRGAIGSLLAGTSVMTATMLLGGSQGRASLGPLVGGTKVSIGDHELTIEVDGLMRSRISCGGRMLTRMEPGESVLTDEGALEEFVLLDNSHETVGAHSPHGSGTKHHLRGVSDGRLEKQISVTLHDRYPGVALIEHSYRNVGDAPLPIIGWTALKHDLPAHPRGAWTFAGASYPDRRDWMQPVKAGFEQRNFMGMNSSDYGGGTPVASVWRPDVGLAVGHVEMVPVLLALPVEQTAQGTRLAVEDRTPRLLAPGETLETPSLFLMAHEGDCWAPLDGYRRLMGDKGMEAPSFPPSSYEPIWCAWGYERNFTTEQIYGTLPKAKDVGLEWVVLDDGWQTSEGDWKVDKTKFPEGGRGLRKFADTVKEAGMRPRIWYAPLAMDPGTEVLRDHPDMLLLGADGKPQEVTWWDSYTMCPAYEPVVEYFRGEVRRMIGDWGFEGIKFDGQHLNGVAPCYNPAHNHARPEESFEKLHKFWHALYETAREINPDAVIELCPCGDAFAFHNISATNNTPASDPLSSWQVRTKGKAFKALMGASAPYAGDHVELSDGGDDFASSYGVGAILSTKFTWPRDTERPIEKLPPGGYVLTPAKEQHWRKWIALYKTNMLSKAQYRGDLYDIGFDRPEAHAIEKDGAMHYAFYAESWTGPVALRGLGTGQYRLTDPVSGKVLGLVSAENAVIPLAFRHAQMIAATPVAGGDA